MKPGTELVALSAIEQRLAAVSSLPVVTEFRDQAAALLEYCKASRKGLRTQNHAAYIKLLCERRAGELLTNTPRAAGPGRGKKNIIAKHSFSDVLKQVGIDINEARRWQLYAKWPIAEIETLKAWCNEESEELTTNHAVIAAKGFIENAETTDDAETSESAASTREETQPETRPAPTPSEKNVLDAILYEALVTALHAAAQLCGSDARLTSKRKTINKWISELEKEQQ
jgi:hypothetical protein